MSMTTVELGYKEFMWKIKLKWENGKLFFNNEWLAFGKAGNLAEGDICVFQKTPENSKYVVSIFVKKKLHSFNKSGKAKRLIPTAYIKKITCNAFIFTSTLFLVGVSQGKSVMKWLKIMNYNSIQTGKVVWCFVTIYISLLANS